MRCVKDCYFKNYVRTENKDGKILYRGWYCELYEKRLASKVKSGIPVGNVMQVDRCKECENHETLYYNDKMNVFKRMVINA